MTFPFEKNCKLIHIALSAIESSIFIKGNSNTKYLTKLND